MNRQIKKLSFRKKSVISSQINNMERKCICHFLLNEKEAHLKINILGTIFNISKHILVIYNLDY